MLRLHHADGHSNAHGQPARLREDAACCVSTSPPTASTGLKPCFVLWEFELWEKDEELISRWRSPADSGES